MQIELYTDLEEVALWLPDSWPALLHSRGSLSAGCGLRRLSDQVCMAVSPQAQLLHRLGKECDLNLCTIINRQLVIRVQPYDLHFGRLGPTGSQDSAFYLCVKSHSYAQPKCILSLHTSPSN